jgi:hypothetical protein
MIYIYTVLFYILKSHCLVKNDHLNSTHCFTQGVTTVGKDKNLKYKCTGNSHLLWLLECKMLRGSTIASSMSLDSVPRTSF